MSHRREHDTRSGPPTSWPAALPDHLRSTFACLWVERGGSLQALKKLLGHSTTVTTQRYADLGEDMLRREVARVNDVGYQR